ncbi:MAG TPA: hypothetical protein VGY77_10290, partial [Gemmataceae bacterium]|nr:hypothetical protein [Gemmataceae bacterium]
MSFSGLGFLVLNLALSFSALEAKPAEETISPDRINKLIEQLGSNQFKEREEATKALEALGTAALEPLQKAIKNSDVEIQRRAEGLVQKIN